METVSSSKHMAANKSIKSAGEVLCDRHLYRLFWSYI